MGKEEIAARILADARTEAESAVREAEAKAEQIIARATETERREQERAEHEVQEKADSIREGKRAAARLDSAKILLGEKRRVIDAVYDCVLKKLLALDDGQSLALLQSLLSAYAEEGDEIVLDEGYSDVYAERVKALSVVKERKVSVSADRAKIGGGALLRGKKADKDVSYLALLQEDRQTHQAEIAAELFRKD